MTLAVCHGTLDGSGPPAPLVKHETVSFGGSEATILLENPRGRPTGLSLEEMATALYGKNVEVKKENNAKFVNLKFIGTDRYGLNGDQKKVIATVILNNPGYEVNDVEALKAAGAKIFGWDGVDCDKVELYHDQKKTKVVKQLEKCQNTTVYFTNVTQKIN